MVITGVYKQRGRLVRLEMEDGAAVTVDARTFQESPYKEGASLSEEELEVLIQHSQQRRAREKAMYLLSLRDHSRVELERKLRRESDRDVAEETAERMEELGLVDDEAYAARRARDLIERRLFSRNRAVQELRARGIARETAQNAVDDIDSDDAEQALALLEKKYYNRRHDEDAVRKTAAALARYGFGGDAIRRAMRAWQSEEQELDADGL